MLHELAFQALAASRPSPTKYEYFVGMFANMEVIPPSNRADEPRLQVEVDHLFAGPLQKAREYFKGDETAVAIHTFLEEREKCRAAGGDRIAAFLIVPALEIIRLIPIIV